MDLCCPPIFCWGGGLPKVAPMLSPLAARRLEKFREDTPTSPEVIRLEHAEYVDLFGRYSRSKSKVEMFTIKIFLENPRSPWGVR